MTTLANFEEGCAEIRAPFDVGESQTNFSAASRSVSCAASGQPVRMDAERRSHCAGKLSRIQPNAEISVRLEKLKSN
jgi:hypothetical protein